MQKILNKLSKVQADIEVMSKDGFNDFNKYKYLMETQVTTKVKELFDKYGLFFHYQSEITDTKEYQGARGDTQFLTTVKVTYSFYDVESGECLSGIAYGQGADKGDKGIYKAITGAIKYIYMKSFNIPTGDDAEKDSPELKSKYPAYVPKQKMTPEEKEKYGPRKVEPIINVDEDDLPFKS